MDFKKIHLFLLLLSLSLIASCGGGGDTDGPDVTSGSGKISHEVYSPLGQKLHSDSKTFNAGQSSNVKVTQSISRFENFGYGSTDSSSTNRDPFCKVGGTYWVAVSYDVPNAQSNGNNDPGTKPSTVMFSTTNIKGDMFPLYSCKTTADLIGSISIPSSWSGDQLILYCNDGSDINFRDINLEYFTNDLNAYKLCILKNANPTKTTENTIIYGFEVGNTEIDKVSETARITAYLNPVAGSTTEFTDKTDVNKKFYFTYDATTTFFSLSSTQEELTTPINQIFTMPSDFKLSRVALFRTYGGNKKAYGYENAYSTMQGISSSNTKPVYRITLTDSTVFNKDKCMLTLASHSPRDGELFTSSDSVLCTSSGDIYINSVSSSLSQNDVAFNLFKNIILDLK